MNPPLIGVDEVRAALASEHPPLLLDVRWRLITDRTEDPDRPIGYADHLDEHLPGAVFVDLATELAAPADPAHGRHPLPAPEDFARAVRRWGAQEGQTLVFHDDQGGVSAARGWWLATHAGLDARLLDGGVQAWIAAGGETEAGPVAPPVPRPPARVGWGRLPVVDADRIQDLAAGQGGVVLDARAPERFRGDVEPIDARAGHVPGAVSLPTAGNLGPGRRFLPLPTLRERFASIGVDAASEVAVYCGSGVSAAHQVAALAEAGIAAALYPGSWSQYSRDASRPVATGA